MDWSRVDYLWITATFYQLFGLSFWRHPFTAEDPLVSNLCNAKFLKICSDEKFNNWNKLFYIFDDLRVYFQQIFIFGLSIPLITLFKKIFFTCIKKESVENLWISLTITDDSSVLWMVMHSPSMRFTITEHGLISKTVYIAHKYLSCTLSKISTTFCLYSISTSHLSTRHCSIW